MKKQDWIISITDVEAVTDTQEPYLSLKINDKWAYIPRRQTFTIIMNGCLSLVGDPRKLKTSNLFYFDRVMPEIEIIIRDDGGNELSRRNVAGFTNDHRIVQYWLDAFGKDILNLKIRKSLEKMGYKLAPRR